MLDLNEKLFLNAPQTIMTCNLAKTEYIPSAIKDSETGLCL